MVVLIQNIQQSPAVVITKRDSAILDRVEGYVEEIREACDKKIDNTRLLQPVLEKMYYDLETKRDSEVGS